MEKSLCAKNRRDISTTCACQDAQHRDKREKLLGTGAPSVELTTPSNVNRRFRFRLPIARLVPAAPVRYHTAAYNPPDSAPSRRRAGADIALYVLVENDSRKLKKKKKTLKNTSAGAKTHQVICWLYSRGRKGKRRTSMSYIAAAASITWPS